MLIIRLQRVGRKNQPVFRIVLAEKHRAAKKHAKEILGHYNPISKEFGLRDESRLKYWIEQHVQISPTAHNLLVTKGLLPGKKVQAWRPKVKPAEPASATPEATTAKVETPTPEVVAPETPAEVKAEELVATPIEPILETIVAPKSPKSETTSPVDPVSLTGG